VKQHLYLDTARLGRMSPTARQLDQAFLEFAAEEAGSAYFDRFFMQGGAALPTHLQQRHPTLNEWLGIRGFQQQLSLLAGLPDKDYPVLIANRSAQLMKLGGRLLFHPCRNVLTTDLDWPNYRSIFESEAIRGNRNYTVLSVRDQLMRGDCNEVEVVEKCRSAFVRNACDGLFLTAVSHDGFRLPVAKIVQAVERTHHARFVVVDGAQDFCNAGSDLRFCDLYITGSHKWLGALRPLGVGFYGRQLSRSLIETVLNRMVSTGEIDDPLLCLVRESQQDVWGRYPETVNVSPLFSCQGAVAEQLSLGEGERLTRQKNRIENREHASRTAKALDWSPVALPSTLRSGILMLRAENSNLARQEPETLRELFRDHAISLTAYSGGLIRLSMPSTLWTNNELSHLDEGLRAVTKRLG
jgi:selenocysteine lyase/cysteine desulfurase